MPTAGVITKPWPSRVNEAARPSTSSRVMEKPRRSRSKRDRSWVAVAAITFVPTSWLLDGV